MGYILYSGRVDSAPKAKILDNCELIEAIVLFGDSPSLPHRTLKNVKVIIQLIYYSRWQCHCEFEKADVGYLQVDQQNYKLVEQDPVLNWYQYITFNIHNHKSLVTMVWVI